MKKSTLIASAAVAGLLSAGMFTPALAEMEGKEKCYGVAKAGQNDCKSANNSHSCASHATTDNDPNEWKLVDAGTCEGMGGSLKAGGEMSTDDQTNNH